MVLAMTVTLWPLTKALNIRGPHTLAPHAHDCNSPVLPSMHSHHCNAFPYFSGASHGDWWHPHPGTGEWRHDVCEHVVTHSRATWHVQACLPAEATICACKASVCLCCGGIVRGAAQHVSSVAGQACVPV
jgi:hypothetical protein